MGTSFHTEKNSDQIMSRTKLSNFVCGELCKLPNYGLLSENEVEAREYHAFRGDLGPSKNLCDILISPITFKFDINDNLCIKINILQDVRAHYDDKNNWSHRWVRIKFLSIDLSNNVLTEKQISQINYGIEMANKKIVLPTWYNENNCQKTLKDEADNHQIIKKRSF